MTKINPNQKTPEYIKCFMCVEQLELSYNLRNCIAYLLKINNLLILLLDNFSPRYRPNRNVTYVHQNTYENVRNSPKLGKKSKCLLKMNG